jgi:hypothetical protein
MDEGLFAFNYQGVLAFGLGCLCLENGRLAGFVIFSECDHAYTTDISGCTDRIRFKPLARL